MTPPGPGEGDELDGRSDHELLAAHVDGDGEAFGVLVQRHRSRLWAVAVRTMRHPEDAADALQDAMVSAYRGAASFRGDSAVTTWLHRVVVNACLDRMRREKVRPTVPLPEHHDPASPRDEHAGTDARLDVMAALARLPGGAPDGDRARRPAGAVGGRGRRGARRGGGDGEVPLLARAGDAGRDAAARAPGDAGRRPARRRGAVDRG